MLSVTRFRRKWICFLRRAILGTRMYAYSECALANSSIVVGHNDDGSAVLFLMAERMIWFCEIAKSEIMIIE